MKALSLPDSTACKADSRAVVNDWPSCKTRDNTRAAINRVFNGRSTYNCRDAGGKETHGAIAEFYAIHMMSI